MKAHFCQTLGAVAFAAGIAFFSPVLPDPFLIDSEERAWMRAQTQLKSLPSLTYIEMRSNFKVDPYLRAAVSLQALGEKKAGEALLQLAGDRARGDSAYILGRMLFTARDGAEFRRPMLGAPTFPYDTDEGDWPLEPIEIVDGVPFYITTSGYSLGGQPEPPLSYIKYCIREYAWNSYRFQMKTGSERQAALEKFFASPKWKRPRGAPEKDTYSILGAQDRRIFIAQIK